MQRGTGTRCERNARARGQGGRKTGWTPHHATKGNRTLEVDEGGEMVCRYAYRKLPPVWCPGYVGYRREQHERADPRAKRSARLHHFLDEPRPDAMPDEKHARRRAIRSKELIEELEVRLDLGRKCHAGRLGAIVRR